MIFYNIYILIVLIPKKYLIKYNLINRDNSVKKEIMIMNILKIKSSK